LIVLVDDLNMVVVVTADLFHLDHGGDSWPHEKANVELVGKFIESLPWLLGQLRRASYLDPIGCRTVAGNPMRPPRANVPSCARRVGAEAHVWASRDGMRS
jgi:hypothetical protein